MKRTTFLFLILMTFLNVQLVFSQVQITGKVTDGKGDPVPGATVTVKEVSGAGTITDMDGQYSIQVPEGGKTLIFSFVGMTSKEISIEGKTKVNASLESEDVGLEEVIVTAMGIERSSKSLGYAVSNVGADETVQKSEPDLLRTLQGKISGVEISGSSSIPGSATRITIRGTSSFKGDNQPLFVVDGIPYSNEQYNTAEQITIGGSYASGISTLDPNSIKSIQVLKGAAAAALYGSRASNGVILIETKAGSTNPSKKGLEITYLSSYSQENPILPDYQNTYGAGHNNTFSQGDNGSWGAPFDLIDSIPQWQQFLNAYPDLSATIPYEAQKDNVKNLFNPGQVWENSITAQGGNQNYSFSMTLSNLNQKGIIPHSKFKRNSISLGGTAKLENGLRVNGTFSYTKSDQDGPILGYAYSANEGAASSFARTMWLNRAWNMDMPYETPEGDNLFYVNSVDNPLWSWANNKSLSQVDRITAKAEAQYNLTNWLTLKALYGVNTYIDNRQQVNAVGSVAYRGQGHIKDGRIWEQEQEGTITLTLKKQFSSDFSVRAVGGYNVNQSVLDRIQNDGAEFVARDINSLKNTITVTNDPINTYYEKSRLYAVFADMQLSFRDYLFLTITGRNDWSSTLPKENNSYFYPSTALSFVFTDGLNIDSDILNFGKVNLSYGKVGHDASPYSLMDIYELNFWGEGWSTSLKDVGLPFNGLAGLTIGNTKFDPDLSPEFTTSIEAGTRLEFFNSRANVELTVYKQNSTDQIAQVTVPESTGYGSFYTNFGEMENRGIELEFDLIPVSLQNGFSWRLGGTYTKNVNEVISLKDGLEQITLKPLYSKMSPIIKVGEPYGVFYGDRYLRDNEGNYLVDPQTGTYINDNIQGIIGNPNPDFRAGLINTFSFKGFTLRAVLDYRQGGDVYSFGVERLLGRGVTKDTEDRENLYVLPGYLGDPNEQAPLYDDNGEKIKNNVAITTNEYFFSVLGHLNDEFSIYNATNIKLREVSLTYEIPSQLLSKLPVGSASISVTGRNLWYYTPYIPEHTNFDPEVNTLGAQNAQGLDFGNSPPLRRWGANLKLSF